VRNEAWVLDRFLKAAALWADHIIVADQGSTDGSADIALDHPKVTVIANSAPAYDEGARQRLLLEAARRIPGRRLIVALDADEALSTTWQSSAQWAAARRAPSGTAFAFDWVNVLPSGDFAWIPRDKVVFAFVDDGSEHRGERIHSTRVPVPDPRRVVAVDDPKVLHFQHTNWRRMESKQRWYQCWEALEHPRKRPVQIYRQYHRMDAFPPEEVHAVDERWMSGYLERGIDMLEARDDDLYWWDEEVFDWIVQHGRETFGKLAVWDVDWSDIGRRLGRDFSPARVRDPRGPGTKAVHRWLDMTQRRNVESPVTRWTQRLLIPFGW
jgi:hypothetical protein